MLYRQTRRSEGEQKLNDLLFLIKSLIEENVHTTALLSKLLKSESLELPLEVLGKLPPSSEKIHRSLEEVHQEVDALLVLSREGKVLQVELSRFLMKITDFLSLLIVQQPSAPFKEKLTAFANLSTDNLEELVLVICHQTFQQQELILRLSEERAEGQFSEQKIQELKRAVQLQNLKYEELRIEEGLQSQIQSITEQLMLSQLRKSQFKKDDLIDRNYKIGLSRALFLKNESKGLATTPHTARRPQSVFQLSQMVSKASRRQQKSVVMNLRMVNRNSSSFKRHNSRYGDEKRKSIRNPYSSVSLQKAVRQISSQGDLNIPEVAGAIRTVEDKSFNDRLETSKAKVSKRPTFIDILPRKQSSKHSVFQTPDKPSEIVVEEVRKRVIKRKHSLIRGLVKSQKELHTAIHCLTRKDPEESAQMPQMPWVISQFLRKVKNSRSSYFSYQASHYKR